MEDHSETRRSWQALAVLAALAVVSLCAGAAAGSAADTDPTPAAAPAAAPTPAAVVPNDYADAAAWLCRPGKADSACAQTQDTSSVAGDGRVTRQAYHADADAKVDCFYVYPTTSEDQTPNSDMQPGNEILATAREFGAFGASCRQFAPLYRSITLRGLRSALLGFPLAGLDPALAYNDVRDAWAYYLAHDNHGRGVVLIGHSQGGQILSHLLASEIEGKPAQQQLVAALLLGANVMVPPGKDVGGSFKAIPLCRSAGQTGCIIAYSTYRATLPPSTDPPAHFAQANDGLVAACTNPAALGSDDKALLDARFSTGKIAWSKTATIDTPYVRVPGLVSGQCVSRGDYRYLEISLDAKAGDARTADIPGDLIIFGRPDPLWGLHAADMPLAMGNLIDLVGRQAQAWKAAHR